MSASFTRWPDLASARLGGRALAASDEFFAPKERLLRAEPPEWRPDEYTDRGKWMDGWETRRRRGAGHDWVVVRLGVPGEIRGVDVDTTHFKGNHPESAEVEACAIETEPADGAWESVGWRTIVPRAPLTPDAPNPFPVESPDTWSHVRLAIHPDGGVARLRVHGVARPDWGRLAVGGPVDLALLAHGGRIVATSDAFFGAASNLLSPGPSSGMFDGWETRRRRGPGHDWVVVALGRRGRIVRVEIGTRYFRGNYPESASLEAVDAPGADDPEAELELLDESGAWSEILPRVGLEPDADHAYEPPELRPALATHVRLRIYPDGGISRLRLFGEPAP